MFDEYERGWQVRTKLWFASSFISHLRNLRLETMLTFLASLALITWSKSIKTLWVAHLYTQAISTSIIDLLIKIIAAEKFQIFL